MTAFVEQIYVDYGVIHQVFADSRKVDQRRDIMECELSGWSDTRQHQNLYIGFRFEDTEKGHRVTYMR